MKLSKIHQWFNKSTLCKFLLVAFLCGFNTSFANSDAIKPLKLFVDHGTPLRLPEAAATIAIGNPDFFNIVTLENNLLMITGVKEGVTSLTVVGKSGQIYQYRVQVTVDIQKLKDDFNTLQAVADFATLRLKNMIQQMEPNVTVENLDGKVILAGEVNSGAALVRVLTLADRFMGGNSAEPDFKVISDYGGILAGNLDEKVNQLDPTAFNELAFAGGGRGGGGGGGGGGRGGAGGGFGIAQQTLLEDKANLAQNISRASVISVANGKVISLIKVVSIPKVEIQMRIVEIDRSKTDQFGIDWRLDGSKVSVGSLHGNVVSTIASPFSIFDRSGNGSTNTGDANLVGFFKPGKYALSAFVKAIEEKGATSTLSEPLLTAISGESARFLVGGSVPIPSQTLAAGNATSNAISVTNVRYLQFGLHITVRPTVLENGKISIVLDQSISEPDYSNAIQILGAATPGFSQKSVSTITESENGETWAVAGLLTEEDRKNLQSVPWISKVPIIGKLFETKDDSVSRNELIILVTARRVDEPNSTTTNFNGHGKLAPKPEQEQRSDRINLNNANEMSSNHLLPPRKKIEQSPEETEGIEKPINLNKSNKDKNNISTPANKSKKLALKQGTQITEDKQSELDSIKIVNLKEKSPAKTNEQVIVNNDLVKSESADVAQVFSFDTERLIKEVIEKKSLGHVVSSQIQTEKITSEVTEDQSVSMNSVPNLDSKKEKPKAELSKSEPKVIHVSETIVKDSIKPSEPITQKPDLNATKQLSTKNLSAKTHVTIKQNTLSTQDEKNNQSSGDNYFMKKNEQANVVVINFLSTQEKNEYFKSALKKGLVNVPPKSEWNRWKIGVGAIDGDVNNLVKFAVSPEMRNKIYSGATVYVELPKSHANYAIDY